MRPRRQNTAGISWTDVEVHIEYLETEHNLVLEISYRRAPKAFGTSMGLVVTVTATGYRSGGSVGYTRARKAQWPTYGHKTMPGLVTRLLHELEESLIATPPKYGKQRKALSYPAS